MDTEPGLLATHLSTCLPVDLRLRLYHVCSAPSKTKPLFSPIPSKKPAYTTVESHFLAVSHQDVLVFAIELMVYVCEESGEQTIFISKADSSGYLPPSHASFTPLNPPSAASTGRTSSLRTIATAFVEHIFNRFRERHPERKTTIALFARSQGQYLFPNSASNNKKHVLTDRGLIAWWCKVLDPLYQKYAVPQESARSPAAYLLVPGLETADTKKLLPRSTDDKQKQWVLGHPFSVDTAAGLTVREVIPHFPDDPKARFLDELNGAEDKKKGITRGRRWKGITSVESFWEHMSFRQECSLGRCVGFIWIVIGNIPSKEAVTDSVASSMSQDAPTGGDSALTSVAEEVEAGSNEKYKRTTRASSERRTTRAGSEQPKAPKLKKTASALRKEVVAEASIVLDEKGYQRVLDSLLHHSDFGDAETAKTGSRKWIERIYMTSKELGDMKDRDETDWGQEVIGKVAVQSTQTLDGEKTHTVNMVNVRKKPKVDETPVNVLPVRKKAKIDGNQTSGTSATVPTEVGDPPVEGVINVLSGSLVRKKRKVEK